MAVPAGVPDNDAGAPSLDEYVFPASIHNTVVFKPTGSISSGKIRAVEFGG